MYFKYFIKKTWHINVSMVIIISVDNNWESYKNILENINKRLDNVLFIIYNMYYNFSKSYL